MPGAVSGDATGELHAALRSCAVADRTELGRLRATGRDILDLLHRLSTADLRGLPTGEGRPTVLTTGKGRIVARLFVHHLEDGVVLLFAGPGEAPMIRAHIDRFTFAEETGLTDVTDETCQLVLIGPRSREALAATALPLPPPSGGVRASIGGEQVWIVGQDGWSSEGVSILGSAQAAGRIGSELAKAVAAVGGAPIGDEAHEAWRVLRGHPAPGRELTGERNPLEAGLAEAISFTKGCYVGQEVVARLRTYDKVSRSLVGLVFPPNEAVPVEERALFLAGREVGELTSVLVPPGGRSAVGLGFVKRTAATPGTIVRAGASDVAIGGRIVSLPFDPIP